MSIWHITGGSPLRGQIRVQGSKNAVLPVIAASLLCGAETELLNCPNLSDVDAAMDILRYLGCTAARCGDALCIDTTAPARCDIPRELMHRMRSSVIFLGPLLARFGEAEVSLPGGCELGPRPIDLHLSALRALGAEIREEAGTLRCEAPRLTGADIVLSLPSVGATENAILTACGADGTTTISNAAREPEIADLQLFLQKAGVRIAGAGSSTVTVCGGLPGRGCEHRCLGDRIAAATYLSAAAAAGGEIFLRGVDYRHLSTVTTALRQAGCRVESEKDAVRLTAPARLRAIPPVRTSPYPGFPTDAQAVLMAALLRSRGTTVFVENMFDSRYRHVPELVRLGADIRTEGRVAVVCGAERLHGARVRAADLRGGAALVLAGLQAEGTTEVEQIHHIERGYADLVGDLRALGAEIRLREA